MMNNPTDALVSVIIPAYNAALYIKETINSVLAQTYKKVEVIIVDDGSTDNTVSIIEKFGNKISLYKQSNLGVSKARNYAVSLAKGYWIAFLDADDIWEPSKLEIQLKSLNDARWSHTNSLYIGENQDGRTLRSDLTKQYGGKVFPKLIVNNFITTSTVLIEKELFDEFEGFDESLEALEDWKLWLDISKMTDLNYQPEMLAKYRVYDGSTSRKARKVLPLHLSVLTSEFKDLSHSDLNNSLKRKSYSNSFNICSYIAEDSSDYSFAIFCAFHSVKNDLFSIIRWKRFARTLMNFISNKIKQG